MLRSGRRDAALLCALVCAIGLPFLDKAFHIDDSATLRIVQNVLDDPLDPFAGMSAWFGRPIPILELATNPPLLSYYLAPFASWSDYSEIVLHAAMMPFLLLFAGALLSLARRFSPSPWLCVLFVMTSSGVVVSTNVMRDIPAAALSTASLALCIAGTDRGSRTSLLLGSVLAGLAILTKYSAIVVVPLFVLYALLKGRWRTTLWALVPIALVGVWSLHNQWIYGETHVGVLFRRSFGPWGQLASWRDNLCGLPVVVGSLLYLTPILVVRSLRGRDWPGRLLPLLLVVVWWSTQRYLDGSADVQYLFWDLLGASLLYFCLWEGLKGASAMRSCLRDAHGSDSLFLLAWLCAPLLFGVVFVPFQAVRHLIPALLPLVLLAFRSMQRSQEHAAAPGSLERRAIGALLAVQAVLALMVAATDYEHADAYRRFATDVRERFAESPGESWYIGHWGWMFYGERAGMRPLYPDGPYPIPGDHVFQPVNYYNGALPREGSEKWGRPPLFQKLEEVSFAAHLPVRAMHPSGAGFYAMYSRRENSLPSLPYRFTPLYPLEIFQIYTAKR